MSRRIARRSVETPLAQRTFLQRFLVALTLGDSGRNMAEVEGCWHLHRIAELEREIYGEVVSPSARAHEDGEPTSLPKGSLLGNGCRAHWIQVEYH